MGALPPSPSRIPAREFIPLTLLSNLQGQILRLQHLIFLHLSIRSQQALLERSPNPSTSRSPLLLPDLLPWPAGPRRALQQPQGPSVTIWKFDEESMEFSEIAVMPQELLYCLFDSEEDDRFASLKCGGLGSLIYVFNEEHHKCYPACVCEISCDLEGHNRCSWRRVPRLPLPVNSFHKVVSFCSTISLSNILETGD